jgi:CP family cyanate transporter-like MFS transporter
VLLLLAILLVAINLRGAIAAVSPVLPEIRVGLDLSGRSAGLLTALPVLCFAAVAPLAGWLGRRVGPERAVLLGCAGIAIGTVARVLGDTSILMAGTVLVGAAMTVGNVLVPALVKRDFPDRTGQVTGLYTAALILGATVAAALTAPIAAVTSWRAGLAGWAVLAVAAAVVWHVATRNGMPPRIVPPRVITNDLSRSQLYDHAGAASASVWRHPVAWAVALFFGFQSVLYFTITGWLPTLLVDELSLTLATAGLGMSVFQLLGIAGTVVVATQAERRPQQGWLALLVAAAFAVMLAGLLIFPAAWPAWSVIGGVAQGAGITLALTLVVVRSADPATAIRLSGMAQLVAYSMGAAGPLTIGVLHESTGGWTVPLIALLVVAAALAVSGVVAGRDTTVGDRPRTRRK